MVSDALRGSFVHRFFPQSLWPYAQLARWERPIGWWLLLWPCWWSLLLAAQGHNPDWQKIIIYLLLFILGAIVMRGAGCTYNDLVDHDIDEKIERTNSRPLPSGRVSRGHAKWFMLAQALVGLIILLQFNTATIMLGVASLILVAIYPFMKRITWWPQLFLGFAFSWGALMGYAALAGQLGLPAIFLYTGSIFWVIGYDTIYAHQDIEDDIIVGVKSTARLFGDNTKQAITGLYFAALCLFAAAFWLGEAKWPAYIGLGLCATHMIWQVKTLDISNPARCLKLFKANSYLGWLVFIGLAASAII